jgi:hypothetical protein
MSALGHSEPPVDAYWSITAYDAEGYLIPNVIERQALGDRDKLVTNADGSLDLYVQTDSPGAGKEANWLPVAKAQPMRLLLAERRNPRRLVDTTTGTAVKLLKSAFGTSVTLTRRGSMSDSGHPSVARLRRIMTQSGHWGVNSTTRVIRIQRSRQAPKVRETHCRQAAPNSPALAA